MRPEDARLFGLVHLGGCPAQRVERFTAHKPGPVVSPPMAITEVRGPAIPMTTIRCQDCAQQVVFDRPESEVAMIRNHVAELERVAADR